MADSNKTDTVEIDGVNATEAKESTVSDETAVDGGTAVADGYDDTAPAEAGRGTPADAHIGIPMPSIGGVPLPSPSIDTGAMVRRMIA